MANDRVIVTHFINPNRFFVCNVSRKDEVDALRLIEWQLQSYCKKKVDDSLKVKNSDVSSFSLCINNAF